VRDRGRESRELLGGDGHSRGGEAWPPSCTVSRPKTGAAAPRSELAIDTAEKLGRTKRKTWETMLRLVEEKDR
jgi:hypothetical protein